MSGSSFCFYFASSIFLRVWSGPAEGIVLECNAWDWNLNWGLRRSQTFSTCGGIPFTRNRWWFQTLDPSPTPSFKLSRLIVILEALKYWRIFLTGNSVAGFLRKVVKLKDEKGAGLEQGAISLVQLPSSQSPPRIIPESSSERERKSLEIPKSRVSLWKSLPSEHFPIVVT